MDVIFVSMLAVVLVTAIVMSIGFNGITYLVESLKSRLTRYRKTKTDPTA